MKIACMQPYFLSYIGYWQLIHAVDKFVILDDVQYITKGWINRNKIIVNGKEQWITIPMMNANKNRIINEIKICNKNQWLPKFKRSISYNFSKSIFFKDTHELLNKIMDYEDNNLCNFLIHSISCICEYLEIKTEILIASNCCPKKELQGQSRIINICTNLGASSYINLPGGKGLYDSSFFLEAGVSLNFLNYCLKQDFLFSIAQTLFENNKHDIKSELNKIVLS
jgi:hypothetical protein